MTAREPSEPGEPTVAPPGPDSSRRIQGFAGYAKIITYGPACRPFVAAVVARLPMSMVPLGIVLLVQHTSGSYAVAGLVTGVFTVGVALGAPAWGRALDRWGQPRVIATTCTISATFLLILALEATKGAPIAVLAIVAALTGASFPPLIPAMRAAWRAVLPDPNLQRTAYALDAVAVETVFITGPLLLSLLLVISPPAVPLIVTAFLMLIAGLLYSATRAARDAEAPSRTRPSARPENPAGSNPATPCSNTATPQPVMGVTFLPPGLMPVLIVGVAMAAAFGAIDTSLAATARDVLNDQAQLGYLFASIAGGSALGGLWFGTRDLATSRQVRLIPVFLLSFSVGLGLLSILLRTNPGLVLLMPVLFLSGMAISPTMIILQHLVDATAPKQRTNEGQAWLATSITTGAGLGTAAAGAVIDLTGVSASLLGASAAALTGSALALLIKSREAPPPRRASAEPAGH